MPENQPTSEDYKRGQRDGLRLALAILAAEEGKWHALLGESRSGRTNLTRAVRHKSMQVAQQRLETALNRLKARRTPAAVNAELASDLDRIGL